MATEGNVAFPDGCSHKKDGAVANTTAPVVSVRLLVLDLFGQLELENPAGVKLLANSMPTEESHNNPRKIKAVPDREQFLPL